MDCFGRLGLLECGLLNIWIAWTVISTANDLTRRLFPGPITITQSRIHLRPDLAHTHAPSTSIVTGTQNVIQSLGRQVNTHATNS